MLSIFGACASRPFRSSIAVNRNLRTSSVVADSMARAAYRPRARKAAASNPSRIWARSRFGTRDSGGGFKHQCTRQCGTERCKM